MCETFRFPGEGLELLRDGSANKCLSTCCPCVAHSMGASFLIFSLVQRGHSFSFLDWFPITPGFLPAIGTVNNAARSFCSSTSTGKTGRPRTTSTSGAECFSDEEALVAYAVGISFLCAITLTFAVWVYLALPACKPSKEISSTIKSFVDKVNQLLGPEAAPAEESGIGKGQGAI